MSLAHTSMPMPAVAMAVNCAFRGLGGFLSTDVSSTPVTDTHFSSSCQQLATAIYASCGLMVIAELLVPLVWLEGCKLERKHGKQRTSWQSEVTCPSLVDTPFLTLGFIALYPHRMYGRRD